MNNNNNYYFLNLDMQGRSSSNHHLITPFNNNSSPFDHHHHQGMMMSSSPKLEDFLGGTTMAPPTTTSTTDSGHHQLHYVSTHDQNLSLYGSSGTSSTLVCNINGNEIGDLNTLISLSSMSNHHHHQAPVPQLLLTSSPVSTDDQSLVAMVNSNNKRSFDQKVSVQKQQQMGTTTQRKSIDTFGQRTSQYRGVTRHRWTGRYEAHLWDNSCKKEGQTRKGRQVYLGGYDMEEKAARAYDLAALKYWGLSTHINFKLENYTREVEEMKNMTRQEYVAHLRRRSSGFSRGASIYRGVTRHHQHGRWQARIGRVSGNKDLYLGTFSTQEEAAEAYDIAAIKFRGTNAVTNFDMSRYDVEKIIASNTLPAGEMARRDIINSSSNVMKQVGTAEGNINNNINIDDDDNIGDWRMVLYNNGTQSTTEKNSCCDDPTGLNGLVGFEPLCLRQLDQVDKPMMITKLDQHFSNPCSLVTASLCSSREKISPIPITKLIHHPFAGSDYGNLTNSLSPAAPPGHISIPYYMPFFAAWNES